MKYTSAEEQVNFGLDKIGENRTVEISLKDLIFVYKTFGELNQFFHQPLHFQKIEDLNEYMGDVNSGAYKLIHQNYYNTIQKYIPNETMKLIEDGEFDHPNPPNYFKEKN